MAGSSLQEVLEVVFVPNAVVHILSRKAYSRAVRVHLLIDAALNALLTADLTEMPWILIQTTNDNSDSIHNFGTQNHKNNNTCFGA